VEIKLIELYPNQRRFIKFNFLFYKILEYMNVDLCYLFNKKLSEPTLKNYQQLFAEGEVNIGEYLPRRSRGEYSPMLTEPEANNCFNIIFRGEYQELQKKIILAS